MASFISVGTLAPLVKRIGDPPESPVYQILQVKRLESPGGPLRHRLVLSDSINFTQSMCAIPLNHLFENAEIERGHLIRLLNFSVSKVKHQR